jgi:hypothetical protein
MGVTPRYLDYLAHFGATVPLAELHASPTAANVVGLRHDIDHDLDAALEMAWWEQRQGCRSTYFLLHTAPYWDADDRLESKALQLQDWGHEVGLHVNALTEWTRGAIDDVEVRLRDLLARLRGAGLQIDAVSAHGDRACYERQFANYWCWRELRPSDPAERETGRSAEGIPVEDPGFRLTYPEDHLLHRYDGAELALWQLSLEELGLSYDAAHVASDRYFTDSGGRWTRSPDPLGEDLGTGRHQVLVHPEHWRDERRRSWLVLSTARSGSRWLAETLDRASPLTARHEMTLNHRYRDGELVAEKHTAEGFTQLADRPEELRALMMEARLWMEERTEDYLEANVYLVHALEQVDEVFPDARLVHLHRDPAEVVRSLLNRDWYDTPEDDRHPRIDVEGWEGMSPLERCCWYVRRVNESLLARDMPRLSLEDVIHDPGGLGAALTDVDVPFYPRLASAEFHERVNASRAQRFPPLANWSAADRATFSRLCGSICRRLGYQTHATDVIVRTLGGLTARLRQRPAQTQSQISSSVLLDERFREPGGKVTVAGATGDWTTEGLVAKPSGDRHVQIMVGSRRWHQAGPEEGWPATIGGWYRVELQPGPTVQGPVNLFCLMYSGEGSLIAQRRLATVKAPEPARASFAVRADAARFALAIHASRDALPSSVAVRRLLLERVH